MPNIDFMNMEGNKSASGSSKSRCLSGWLIFSVLLIIGLIIGLIVQSTQISKSNASTVKWCTMSDAEQQKCNELSKLLQFTCYQRTSVETCVSAVESGKADAMNLDGGHIFSNANKLKPVMAEDYGEGDVTYWAVAVVKKTDTTTFFTKPGLQGKTSCHTGVNRTAGWLMALGALKSANVIAGCDMNAALKGLFSRTCAPGGQSENLCTACSGTCNRNCAGEDYCGYAGAFRCMVEGGNVAFVKHTTVSENTNGQNTNSWAIDLKSSDYELLCMDGTRAPVSAYVSCNLGKVPSHAVVVRVDAPSSLVNRVVEALIVAEYRYGPNSDSDFKLFGGTGDLMFSSSTQQLIPLKPDCTPQSFLGNSYLAAQSNIQCKEYTPQDYETCLFPKDASVMTARWCVTNSQEFLKCNQIASVANGLSLDIKMKCVLGDSEQGCAALMKLNSADLVTMDGGHIYTYGLQYGLQPVVAEDYGGDEGVSYYAVAAVKATDNSTTFTKTGLDKKKSCHTGYGKTSGWNVPVGQMYKKDILTGGRKCDTASAVAFFFSQSCVPGIQQTTETESVKNQLCTLCNTTCDVSGYQASFDCLKSGRGDIAFIKHTTIGTDDKPNYKLLCLNGTTATVDQYLSCHLAKVPAHGLMTTNFHDFAFRDRVWNLLEKVQEANPNILFTSPAGSKNLIFKDSTKCLRKVSDTCTWIDFLGQDYLNSLEGLQCTSSPSSYTAEQCQYYPSQKCQTN